jgi:hypothetical protein
MLSLFFYVTLEGLHYVEISTNIGRATLGRNFDVLLPNCPAYNISARTAQKHRSSVAV